MASLSQTHFVARGNLNLAYPGEGGVFLNIRSIFRPLSIIAYMYQTPVLEVTYHLTIR